MYLIRIACLVLVLGYAPLLVVGTLDPASNPIGLGLLSVAASLLAAVLIVTAALRGLWRLLRPAGR
jgi:hypothetical protein